MTYTAEHVSPKGRINSFFHRNRFVIHTLLSFGACFILSGATDHGECTNFGAAMVGALGAGLQGAVSLLGCAIGYSLFFGFDEAAIYIASAVVIYTISFVCQYSPIYKSRYFAIINVSLVLGITSAFDAVTTVRGYLPYYLELVLEIFRGAIMTYVYQVSMQPSAQILRRSDAHRMISLLICASSFIVSCNRFQIAGEISFGRILFFISLLTAVRLMDTTIMCLTTIIFSLAVSASSQEAVNYLYLSVLYMVSCMLFVVKTKKVSATILLVSAILISFVNETVFYNTIYEISVAIVIFFLIPTCWFSSLALYLQREKEDMEGLQLNIADDKSKHMAELLSNISALLHLTNEPPKPIDTIEVFQCAVDRVCNGCCKRDICWENHQSELLEMFFELKHKAECRGKLKIEDFSAWFNEYCISGQIILTEINFELRNRAEKRLYETSLKEKTNITCDILDMVSNIAKRVSQQEIIKDTECKCIENKIIGFFSKKNMECTVIVSMIRNDIIRIELQGKKVNKFFSSFQYLEELSEILNMRLRVMKEEFKKDKIVLYKAEPYAVSVGVATKKKKGEQVCGDCYSYFKTEQGAFYVILSDGLGTGEHAEKQSSFLIRLMEQFVIGDLLPMEAVQLTNMIVSLNNREQWDCATIDFFCLDLYTGKADIYKIGAAPSYLNCKNEFRQIAENMLSAGSAMTDPLQVYHESFLMEPEDTLVIMSDGVIIDHEEDLREMICNEEDSMKILARTILLNSQRKYSSDDDMTVLAIRMEHRV